MKVTETARAFCRRRNVELASTQIPTATIAEVFGVTNAAVYRWRRLGCPEQTPTPRSLGGRPRKLTDEQLTELEKLLLKGATAYGWPNELWTTKRIAKVIRSHFHITCHPNQAWLIVTKYMGWTAQRPVQRLSNPDDAVIARWLENDYPRILERARRRGAYLVFVDESGFMLAPVVRRSYAPRGHPPVCKISNPHGKISAIGAMTISPERRHYGFYYSLLPNNENFHGDTVVPFLRQVRGRLVGPITLIWDTIPIHRANPVRAYLNRHRTIVTEAFPRYASELNPVDKIWFYVKYDRLPNYAAPDLADLRAHVKKEFLRLQKRSDILASLFNLTQLCRKPL